MYFLRFYCSPSMKSALRDILLCKYIFIIHILYIYARTATIMENIVFSHSSLLGLNDTLFSLYYWRQLLFASLSLTLITHCKLFLVSSITRNIFKSGAFNLHLWINILLFVFYFHLLIRSLPYFLDNLSPHVDFITAWNSNHFLSFFPLFPSTDYVWIPNGGIN